MYRSRTPTNWTSMRIAMVAAMFAAMAVLLVVRAYRLHVAEAHALAERAEKQRTRVLSLETKRGMIFDRSGEQLASSLEVNSICASPRRISDKNRTAKILAEALEMKEAEVLKRLNEDRAFVWIRRRVFPLPAENIKKEDLQGVFSVTEHRRFYPLRSLAAHAVGFAGIDSKGLEGLELYYDDDLKSEPLPVTAQKDALGRPVMFAAMTQGPGRRDLHVTLDRNIQYIVEKELDEAVRREHARSSTAIVMDADTGEILAMAIRPAYNLNIFQKVPADVRRNRAATDAFEPGSTFKVFLAAAVLDLGKVTVADSVFCHQGRYRLKGTDIHDIVPRGWLTFADVVVFSSNIGAVKVSEKLTKGEFYRALRRFGFGSPTGVDLPGERPGALARPGCWSALTKPTVAFGQGITVNAFQLVAAFAATINGGVLYRPHLMARITDAFGATIREYRPTAVRHVIKKSTSDKLVAILRNVILRGTGKAANIPDVFIVGKTGTAQKADPAGGYAKDKYVASFIGALMETRPRLVIFVMIDEPGRKERTGGSIAAPVFRRIAEAILGLCGSDSTQPAFLAASREMGSRKPQRSPGRRMTVKRGPKPGEWIVPDLKGRSMREVLEVCGQVKCEASFRGFGKAVEQSPKAGEVFKEGAVLEVTFKGSSS